MSILDNIIYNGTEYGIGGIDEEAVNALIAEYIEENNIEGVTDEEVQTMVDSYLDENASDNIDAWLNDHPEATTTVQDGSISMAKLANDVLAKFTYKWNAVGYMRTHVREFQGWPHCIVFDSDLNCAVGIVNSGNASHTNIQPWYRVTIDNSGYMSPYEEIKVYDTDGTTPFTPTGGYMGALLRLEDGSYMGIDITNNIYTSTDQCKTLKRVRTYAFTTGSQEGGLFGLTKLSNGRLIAGHSGGTNGFWYSDNDGVTWTNIIPSASNLGQQAYPEGSYKPFEPTFIEYEYGKIIAYARKSNSAGTSPTTTCTIKEPAVYSISTDYGTTWSAWENSTSIIDMTACNGQITIIDGVVHFVYGSRYHATDNYFHLFYTYAKLEDAYDDNWATPVVLDVGHWDMSTATNPHDCGYPSLWQDENNNLYAVYYDSDGTGSAFGANWRLCTGAPVEKAQAVYNGGSGSYNVAYSQKAVDDKFAKMQTTINEILLLLDQTPEDTGSYDGTSPIFDSLVAWFDVTNDNKWNDYTLTSMVGDVTGIGRISSTYTVGTSTSAPTGFNNGFAGSVGQIHVQKTVGELTNNASTFTVEYLVYQNENNGMFILYKTATAESGKKLYHKTNNVGNTYRQGLPYHYVAIISDGAIDWYVNGAKITTDSITETYADILTSYIITNAPRSATGAAVGDVRIYSRALTQDEITNNYLYTQHETNYTTAPVFTTE